MSNSSNTLRKRILLKHGTIVEFARAAGVERSQVYRLLDGLGLTLDTAARVAAALDMSIDQLASELGMELINGSEN